MHHDVELYLNNGYKAFFMSPSFRLEVNVGNLGRHVENTEMVIDRWSNSENT